MMFSNLKAVLIDLSGTIHIESNEIPGSIMALKRLKESGIPYRFVTNTTKESRRVLHQRLTGIGFPVQPEEIYTSLIAARDLVCRERLKPHLMLESAALEDFQDIGSVKHSGEAVVIGLAPSHFHYEALNESFQKLLNGARLVAIHQGRYYKTGHGTLALGPGPFVHGLAYAADIRPDDITVVGKPDRNFFLSALGTLNVERPEDAVMIGDDVRDDIAGAMRLGMPAILVQTGKYRPNDEQSINPSPTLTVPSFSVAIETILSGRQH